MSAQPPGSTTTTDFHLERYRYILQQLHATNENVYRFLAIYQSLATAIAGAALALFVGYGKWGIDPGTAKAGIVGLMCLVTLVSAFTVLLLVVGVLTWIDYRTEECELTDVAVAPGFRTMPSRRNLVRWHETYIIAFVVVSTIVMWVLATAFLLQAID